MEKIQIRKQEKENQNLEMLSKEQLIAKVKALQAHNNQLKNIIYKSKEQLSTIPKSVKPFDFSRCTFRHVLLRIFYLGWDYQGFVTQEDTTNTIEYHLFQALTRTCLIKDRASSNYHRCGRTDKGVSSFGQVISLDLRSKLLEEHMDKVDEEIDYCNMLNKVLPDNIQCVAWAPVPPSFSARFDCKSRTYKYFFPKGNLDIPKMKLASEYLIGREYDFRNLCKMDVGNGVVKFGRNISLFTIEPFNKDIDHDYTIYVATIKSKAFLWHQIRCIMSVLFHIGEHKEEPEVIKELLDVENNPRKPEYSMASEIPLNLYSCEYDNVKWQYSEKNNEFILKNLSNMWSVCSTKQTIIQDMLNSLSTDMHFNSSFLIKFLVPGVKSKVYIPFMKRKRCECLEDKIKHFHKRNRIEIVEKEESISE